MCRDGVTPVKPIRSTGPGFYFIFMYFFPIRRNVNFFSLIISHFIIIFPFFSADYDYKFK
jgi:hypothetical protein